MLARKLITLESLEAACVRKNRKDLKHARTLAWGQDCYLAADSQIETCMLAGGAQYVGSSGVPGAGSAICKA